MAANILVVSKTNTRMPCDVRMNINWSAQSNGNHAKDSRHEFTTEKIRPSAILVAKGHAPEAIALDLHRPAQNRQWPVIVDFEFLGFVLHATTCAGIRKVLPLLQDIFPAECVDMEGNRCSNTFDAIKGFFVGKLFWEIAVPTIAFLTIRARN